VVAVGSVVNGQRQIQNVAPGVISSASTDAVNGSQLYLVAAGVTSLGTSTAAALGGGSTFNSATGAVSNPTYNVAGGTQNNVGAALAALNTEVSASSAPNAVLYDNTGKTSVTLGGVGAAAPVALGNVAAGAVTATSTDAVNGSQLYTTNQQVAATTATANSALATAGLGWNVTAQGANTTNVAPGGTVDFNNSDGNVVVSKSATSNNVTVNLAPNLTATSLTAGNAALSTSGLTIIGGPNGAVSVSGSGLNNGGNTIGNVGAGAVSASSTDAVNGSQLYSVSQAANAGWNVASAASGNGVATNTGAAANVAPGRHAPHRWSPEQYRPRQRRQRGDRQHGGQQRRGRDLRWRQRHGLTD